MVTTEDLKKTSAEDTTVEQTPKVTETAAAADTASTASGAETAATSASTTAGTSSATQGGSQEAYDIYQNAISNLQQMSQSAPTYNNQYQDAINAAYDAIINRDSFSYDLNEDQLYQQYRDKYLQQAKTSMKDTMGQAASLTGGYGSSYSQAVGQQAYDAQLQNLNDVVPELYSQAYSQYQDEGDQMLQNYNLLLNREATDYDRYNDDYTRYENALSNAYTDADTAYNRWYNERSYEDSSQSDAYNKLISLAPGGYTPTEEELSAAGLTQAQWDAIYTQYGPAKSSGGGGGGSSFWENIQRLKDEGYSSAVINTAIEAGAEQGIITRDEASKKLQSIGKNDYLKDENGHYIITWDA